jgi:AcrR family transcriptional regulator
MTRREAILEAALDAFERKGVLAATIDDIRSASRASVGSIYHHFGDKAGIVDALYAWLLGDWQRGFLQALGGKGAEAGARAGVVHNVSVMRHQLGDRAPGGNALSAPRHAAARGGR